MWILILFWFFPITFLVIFLITYLLSDKKALKIISGIFFISIIGTGILAFAEPQGTKLIYCGIWLFTSIAYMVKKDML